MPNMPILKIVKDQFNLRVHEEGITRIEKVLSLLTEEEVWYRPNDEANSIGHLILHLCGNVTQWIGSGIGRQVDRRERDLEFGTTEHLNKELLIKKLHTLRPITDQALAKITSSDQLTEPRKVQGFDETVLGILIHVTEHFSYHVGQVAIIAKYLKGVDLGFYADMDLNVKN